MKNQKQIRDAKTVARDAYAWPGGYPLYLVMVDGDALCPKCVKENFALIVRATRDDDHTGWASMGAQINYEEPDLNCAHCSQYIDAAYVDRDEVVAAA